MGSNIAIEGRRRQTLHRDRRNSSGAEKQAMVRASRILLVEDNPPLRVLLAFFFRSDGFEVIEAVGASDAASLLARVGDRAGSAIDLVVIDVRRSRASSLDVLVRLRRDDAEMPIILIAADDVETRHKAEQLGVNAVFSWPFELEDLRTAVFYWT